VTRYTLDAGKISAVQIFRLRDGKIVPVIRQSLMKQ
jgi:hypothetical protein